MSHPRSRTQRPASSRPGRALALVAAGALLAGCSTGVAARDGDTVVSDDDVSIAAQQYGEITGRSAMLAGVATALSRADTVSAVMAEHGVTVADGEIPGRIADEGGVLPEGGLAPSSLDLWRSVYEFEDAQQLPQEEQAALTDDLSAALQENQATLNPRYSMSPDGRQLLPTWVATTTRGAQEQQAPTPVPAG